MDRSTEIAWERRESETEHDYMRFVGFMCRGPGRTLDLVDPDADRKEIARLAARENWFSRVEAWDASLSLNETEIALRRQSETIQKLWIDGEKLRKLGLVILDELVSARITSIKETEKTSKGVVRTTEKNVKNALDMIKEGVAMQARACGLDQDKVSQEAPPTAINIMVQENADMKFVEVDMVESTENADNLPTLPKPDGD